jgi:hypothetical protein
MGFLSGALIAIFAEPLRHRFFRPRLRITFNDSADCVTPTPAKVGGIPVQAWYIRAKITNDSEYLARSCRVFLTEVERRDDKGVFHRTDYCDSIQLAWSVREGLEFEATDVPNSVNCFVDIFSTVQGSSDLSPRLRSFPYRYHALFKDPATYRLTIHAIGDGAKTAKQQIIVDWKGQWDTFTVRAAP